MELPVLNDVDAAAAAAVAGVLWDAKRMFGSRISDASLRRSSSKLLPKPRHSLAGIQRPLAAECEKFIRDTIEHRWGLTEYFKYCIKYVDSSCDDVALYYYFEAIFSQPTPECPVPQQTASVYFRLRDEKTEENLPPTMTFRVEGQHSEHDISQVTLTADPLFATLKLKADIFREIEEIGVF